MNAKAAASRGPWGLVVCLLLLVLLGLLTGLSLLISRATLLDEPVVSFVARRWLVATPLPDQTDTGAWQPGKKVDVYLTLIGADAERLACADPAALDGVHCGFRTDTERWPGAPGVTDDNQRDVLQPYRTSPDNKLVLIAGIWATPALATRLHEEPPSSRPEKQLQRFVARCEVEFLGKLPEPKLRWNPKERFAPPAQPDYAIAGGGRHEGIPAGRALSCTIVEGKTKAP